jgi:hypothetical protein
MNYKFYEDDFNDDEWWELVNLTYDWLKYLFKKKT